MRNALISLAVLVSFGAGCAPLDTVTSLSLGSETNTTTSPAKTATTTLEDLENRDIGAEVSAKIKANVSISKNGYTPKLTILGQGATITFKNSDRISHSVTSDIGKFDVGVILPGNSKSLSTKNLKPGTYEFHDMLHPELKGTIKIHD